MTVRSAVLYDLRGLKCPLPAMRSRKKLSAMTVGDELLVDTTDPLAVIDIPHMCNEEGHTLIEKIATQDGHRFRIRKG
ncbi:sulfurtransferase TusA family protein [Agrobacterium larrymoorei]|uniref:sulfurtransferase TusA family protein n=1 Tax=Agrobacterium larrymoorei TaxID=160699 RepID=UPI0015716D10|nr:sulfurtransferase TusA family protein [Agrobacterium larrymoorei]NTJ44835.1 sulfurtransferase TusA family protein [Agrobacterium larrymoorei]